MTPPDRDHPSLREDSVDTSIWSTDVVMSDRHWWEDNVEGWAADPRPLRTRIAEVLARAVLTFAPTLLALWVLTKLVD